MTKSPSALLRSSVAALLLSPSFASVPAAAQAFRSAPAAGTAARAPLALGAMPLQAPSFAVDFTRTLDALPALAPALTAAPAAGLDAAASARAFPAPAGALAARAAAPSEAPAVRGAMASALDGVFRSGANPADAAAAAEGRMNILFDGAGSRRALDVAAPVAGSPALRAAAALERSSPAASAARKTAPPAAAQASRAGSSLAVKVLAAAVVLLAAPAVALAATGSGPVVATAAAALTLLANVQPLASAVGALAGAVYGMLAARPKDGSEASTGEIFASILRYGVLGGAGVYALLDLTQIAYAGAAVGLQSLTSAVAMAALGRTAFQDKFMYPSTTAADRIFGAFPAAAAAVGISVGLTVSALAAPALAFTVFTGAMAATGVATALYAALFKPGRSLVSGPARMAQGYVLQALMTGLALAVTNPSLFWPFAIMGAAGFGLVMWTTALEIWAHRPGAPAQPLPAPPVTKA